MTSALLGLLALAGDPTLAAFAPPVELAALELWFSTRAGEGATGIKRFHRDGCYEIESEGGTGGAGRARDSQAGCHRAADVARVFAKIDGLARGGLVLERKAIRPAGGGAPRGGAPGLVGEDGPGGSDDRVVLQRANGTRWVPSTKEVAQKLVAALDELPAENQWYAKPPEPPAGTGPQLVVLSVSRPEGRGPRRVEGALAADGRWWCYRSIAARPAAQPKLPPLRAVAITGPDATARLERILAGVSRADADGSAGPTRGAEVSVEIVPAGGSRDPLRPITLRRAIASRFAAEMRAQSAACALP